MSEALRAEFFVTRPGGEMVPLVALDELPAYIALRDVPRTVAVDDFTGMTCVGKRERRGFHTVDNFFQPTAADSQLPDAQARLATDHHHEVSGGMNHPNSSSQVDNSASRAPGSTFPLVSGTSTHVTKAKTYCSYWIRHGECDYYQQGCLYKHEMPRDPETLATLGLRDIPQWYREQYGLPSLLARTGPTVRSARSEASAGHHDSNSQIPKGNFRQDTTKGRAKSKRGSHTATPPPTVARSGDDIPHRFAPVPKKMTGLKTTASTSYATSETDENENTKSISKGPAACRQVPVLTPPNNLDIESERQKNVIEAYEQRDRDENDNFSDVFQVLVPEKLTSSEALTISSESTSTANDLLSDKSDDFALGPIAPPKPRTDQGGRKRSQNSQRGRPYAGQGRGGMHALPPQKLHHEPGHSGPARAEKISQGRGAFVGAARDKRH